MVSCGVCEERREEPGVRAREVRPVPGGGKEVVLERVVEAVVEGEVAG